MTISRFLPNGRRLSHVLVHNGIAYITGQTPADRSQGIEGQTKEVLARLDELLATAGTDKSKILFAQIWLKHAVQDFAAMNAAWDEWIPADALPARATVEANMVAPEILIEIAVQASVEG
ncbi:RidA family protein [Mesorhizobium sp. M7A.F.Ca.US.011.01.1.1]|uniref:RidA family protein n=1 Tax=Mesorhizobium sp. M7A.F.Ca.US.011.01.1.1 TaxID=2496741 RepID=UPI000FCBF8DA|nr:RidA family protein [Mesorhizobium sp. M7A.F.Ca.US.011.01.1.1]RUX22423.1 RidA family protein [Mesorhizobium sp. M7A.F.Ca.US.011.01.1.1]